MRTRWFLILVGAATGILSAMAPPVALVMDFQGTGHMLVDRVSNRLSLLAELNTGSEVKLDPGSRLVLVTLGTGEEIQVEGPAAFRLDKLGHPVGKLQMRIKRVQALRMPGRLRPGGLAQASVVMREVEDSSVSRDRQAPLLPRLALQSPPSAATLLAQPRFSWSSLPGASWTFTLSDAAGRTCLRMEGSTSEAKLPAGESLKAGASYTWQLTGRMPDGTSREGTGHLRRLAAEEAAVLRQAQVPPGAPFARRLLYASLLEKAGMHAEACEVWAGLLRERPGQPVLLALLGNQP